MSIRQVRSITILAEVGESVSLPNTAVARMANGDMQVVNIDSWTPNTVDTSQEGEFVFAGVISGYIHPVLCSVIVGDIEEDPPSVFPKKIDDFGIQKEDIHTADIPDIDDYQYFKAKAPRTAVENVQLQSLKELLANKIIMARDVNHMRNAIIAIEEYLGDIGDRLDELEERVEKLEEETVIGGENIGDGIGIFSDVVDRVMQFKTLAGSGGVEITETDDTVTIKAPEAPDPETGCDANVKFNTISRCTGMPMKIGNGYFDMTNNGSFGFRMVKLVANSNGQHFNSLLITLGQGQSSGVGAGRILKIDNGFIFETKNGTIPDGGGAVTNISYTGLEISTGNTGFYTNKEKSRINANIADLYGSGGNDAYNIDNYADYNMQ